MAVTMPLSRHSSFTAREDSLHACRRHADAPHARRPRRISVSDLDASVAFYSALTGREPVAEGTMSSGPSGRSQGLPVAKLRYATINIDGLGIDLIQCTDPVGERTDGKANRPGSMHLCFKADDFDAVYERTRDAGYDFLGDDYTFIAGEVTPAPRSAPRSRTSTARTAPTWRSSTPRALRQLWPVVWIRPDLVNGPATRQDPNGGP
ncbi:VOC family protein [Streptomyces sp. NPDC016309]|uniref:VOC family protein n=1 Tax=Streptomyces sp. NPDC016309 TaxID=3364965 RepID=UPI0036F92AE8